MRCTFRFLFVLLLSIAALHVSFLRAQDSAPAPVPPNAPYKNTALPADQRVQDLLKRMTLEEKATMLSEQNKVVFQVAADASKDEIAAAVEALFKVNVTKVNTLNVKGKTKRFGGIVGRRADVKKAVVTLAEGQSIDITTGL